MRLKKRCEGLILKKSPGGKIGPHGEKFRRSHSLTRMKITVKLDDLNNEQMKFLSQLGEFRDTTWVGGCDPDEFEEAMDWLKRAGIDDVYVQWGE